MWPCKPQGDAGPDAAGASFGALESSFPLQDAFCLWVIIAVLETSNRPWAGHSGFEQ
jgi:hypothetical protein